MINQHKIKISDINFNQILTDIKLKKQHLQRLTNKINLIKKLNEKNYKSLNLYAFNFFSNQTVYEEFLITYLIDITFFRRNCFLTVMDFAGNVKFFYSAGSFGYPGKVKKTARSVILKDFYKILTAKLEFLKNQPLALNLKNVGYFSQKKLILRLLRKKFFIKVMKSFVSYPYNGCRRKKIRRKKFRRKKIKKRRNGRVV